MGIEKNVGFDVFPKQGDFLGKRVKVCFNFDTSRLLHGEIVREDMEEPYQEIIKLEDGRYILTTECQYSVVD